MGWLPIRSQSISGVTEEPHDDAGCYLVCTPDARDQGEPGLSGGTIPPRVVLDDLAPGGHELALTWRGRQARLRVEVEAGRETTGTVSFRDP